MKKILTTMLMLSASLAFADHFQPTSGTYEMYKAYVGGTCFMKKSATRNMEEKMMTEISNVGPAGYTQTISEMPDAPINCKFNPFAHTFKCTADSFSMDLHPNYDAVISFKVASYKGQWMCPESFMGAVTKTFECAGNDCETVGHDFFGQNFTFPCDVQFAVGAMKMDEPTPPPPTRAVDGVQKFLQSL